jgi:hypothetical protein
MGNAFVGGSDGSSGSCNVWPVHTRLDAVRENLNSQIPQICRLQGFDLWHLDTHHVERGASRQEESSVIRAVEGAVGRNFPSLYCP